MNRIVLVLILAVLCTGCAHKETEGTVQKCRLTDGRRRAVRSTTARECTRGAVGFCGR